MARPAPAPFYDQIRLLMSVSERTDKDLGRAAGIAETRLGMWYERRPRYDNGSIGTLNEYQLDKLARALGYEICLRPLRPKGKGADDAD